MLRKLDMCASAWLVDQPAPARTRFSDFSVEKYQKDRNEVIRGVVSRFARGNVSVQQGRYMSHDELERLRDELSERVTAS